MTSTSKTVSLSAGGQKLRLPATWPLLSPSLTLSPLCSSVNVGGYIQAVLDRNLAENISRVLYPNDNVRHPLGWSLSSWERVRKAEGHWLLP
jgi:hypothetical protein